MDLNKAKGRLGLLVNKNKEDAQLPVLLEEAAIKHKYTSAEVVPENLADVMIGYAYYFSMKQEAVATAANPRFNLKKVSIDRSGASGNYQALTKMAYRDYCKEAIAVGITPLGYGKAMAGNASRTDEG